MQKQSRVSVIGAGECGPELSKLAQDLGRGLARRGHALVCGGLGGVMEAASRGAAQQGGIVIGILPGTERRQANRFVTIPLVSGLGHMRNYLVVANGDIVCALGGGYGTLSEIALARKIGRRVVVLNSWDDISGVTVALDVDDMLSIVDGHLKQNAEC